MSVNVSDLALAIELVRHRGLQKRIDAKNPDIAKITKLDGKDWTPCAVCTQEARLIYGILSGEFKEATK